MERGRTTIVLRIAQEDYLRLQKMAKHQGITPNTLATSLLTPQIRLLENKMNQEKALEEFYNG